MAEVPQFASIEAEIKFLEEKMRERRAALEEKAETIEEKEILHEVIREHIQNIHAALPPSFPPQPSVPLPDPLQNIEEHQEKIAKLIEIVFSRGITEAIRVAQRLHDPHLLDEFHDTLVDRFYKHMVSSGVIQQQQR